MKKEVYRADSRGGADHGWLKTRHSFSFADYYDPTRMGFGALRVLNDDEIAPTNGFGRHSHSNMEIITIPLEGAVTHSDNMGNQGEVRVGEVQVMSAGSGVVHSEENKSADTWLKLFQIWIETDSQFTDIAPRYKQQALSDKKRQNAWQILVAPQGQGKLDIMQNAWILRASVGAGKDISYDLKEKNNGLFVLVIDGKVNVADENLGKRDALGLMEVAKVIFAAEVASDILLIEVPIKDA